MLGEQVEGNCGKLSRRTALEEKYSIIVGYAHKLAECALGAVEDLLELGRSMVHLHYGHSAIAVAKHFRLCLLEDLDGEDRRACGKIINSLHTVIGLRRKTRIPCLS